MFIVVITENKEKEEYWQSILPQTSYKDETHILLFTKGRAIRGLHHRGNRPHIIVCDYEITTEKEKDWEIHCVRPAGNNKTEFIRGSAEIDKFSKRFL